MFRQKVDIEFFFSFLLKERKKERKNWYFDGYPGVWRPPTTLQMKHNLAGKMTGNAFKSQSLKMRVYGQYY